MTASAADIDSLSGSIPFDECDELIVLAGRVRVIDGHRGYVPAERGSSDEWGYYLLKGVLHLVLDDGEHHGLSVHPLYTDIHDDLPGDRLVLPSLPDIAVKIRHLIEGEVSVQQVATLVQTDPVINAKLMKIANGALYHGLRPMDSCQQAVSRLGLESARNLVVGFVLRNLFKEKISTALLARHARQLWEHSVGVGAIARNR